MKRLEACNTVEKDESLQLSGDEKFVLREAISNTGGNDRLRFEN